MDPDFEQPIKELEDRIAELTRLNGQKGVNLESEIAELRKELKTMTGRLYGNLSPWQIVQVARHENRPVLQDYMKGIFNEFIELHGDRCHGDDRALIGGFATLNTHRVMLLGMEKGKSVEEKIKSNFGMANPEGYRKALRLMRLAEKYGLPVVCLVPDGHGGARNAHSCPDHGRRRQRRCARRRRGRHRADAFQRDLFGYPARRLRGHPLA